MRAKRFFVVAAFIAMTVAGALQEAQAALLGLQNKLNYPLISFISRTATSTSYSAAGKLFSVSTTPSSIQLSATATPTSVIAPTQLTIQVPVANDGTLVPASATNHDLVLTGTITVNGTQYVGTTASPLLSARSTGFGFLDQGATDTFEMKFDVGSGQLKDAGVVTGSIGVLLTSESSSFANSFSVNFNGKSKGTLGVIPAPGITVTETCSDAPAPGEAMPFTVTVSNSGNEQLTSIACVDAQGAAIAGVPATLDANAAPVTVAVSYNPTATPFTQSVSCSATGSISLATVSASSDSATCAVLTSPAIKVEGACSDAAAPGHPIVVSARVTNNGNETLTAVSCTDSNGALAVAAPATLIPGGTVQVSGSYLPAGSGSADTITCTGSGAISHASVSANSTSSCNIETAPSFSVTQSCKDATAPGQPINLSGVIKNTGNETLTGFSCSDSKGAVLTGVPATLAPGASAAISGSYLPTGSGSTDSISCSARGAINNGTVSASSNSTCGIVTAPALVLTESCANAPAPGQAITLSATITNSGNEPLNNFSCSDSKGATLSGIPASLAPGQTAAISGSYLPTASGSTDTVSCTASGAINSAAVTANASSTCSIVTAPAFSISQNCSNAQAPGEPIALSAQIVNTGNEQLTQFSCTDSKGAVLTGIPATLAPGQSASLSGNYIPTGSGSTDTITCSALGSINSKDVSGNSSATCNIVTKPAFSVSENCSNAPAPGQPITLSAQIVNTGNEPLTQFSCSDSKGAVLSGIPTNLAPGQSVTLSGNYIPTGSGSSDTITCSALGSINSAAVSGNSSATCSIATKPAFSINESCSNAPAPGQPITLSALIVNTGNEALTKFSCTDSKGSVLSGVPTTLAAGASTTVTGSYLPTASGSTDTISCSASGAINSGAVSAKSSSTCSIVTAPALSIVESCSFTSGSCQAAVTVSAIVSNTGNETLTGFSCSGSKGMILSGIPIILAPGATSTVTGSYKTSGNTYSDTISCSATGTTNGAKVTASSGASCAVAAPAIKIKKLTNGVDAPSAPGPNLPFGSQVTWSYVVTNSGNVPLTKVVVSDNKVASVSCPQTTLAAGATMTCTATGSAIAGQYENIGKATGSAGSTSVSSSYASHYFGTTNSGCTYTQGYWKNHPEKWPVATLKLGAVSYTKQQLLGILAAPVKGNGLISLAHQLISAKLNSLDDASLTPAVLCAINSADAMIASRVVPPAGTGYLTPSATSNLEGTFDDYNNGIATNGPRHCGDDSHGDGPGKICQPPKKDFFDDCDSRDDWHKDDWHHGKETDHGYDNSKPCDSGGNGHDDRDR